MLQERPNDRRGQRLNGNGFNGDNGDNGDLNGFRRTDRRSFVHKSFIGRAIGGVVKRAIPAIGIAESIVRTISPRRPTRPTAPRTVTARPTVRGSRQKQRGREAKFGGNGNGVGNGAVFTNMRLPARNITDESPCRFEETPRCCRLRNGSISEQAQWQQECGTAGNGGRGRGTFEVGDAVMGRYGAALEPGVQMIERSVCLPGMHLANDGLCYNKGAITNKQRQWPRGRRPLLTGGDMRAIGIAARAGAKLDRTTKRLRALGMMKKLPAPRKAAPHAHAQPVAAVSV